MKEKGILKFLSGDFVAAIISGILSVIALIITIELMFFVKNFLANTAILFAGIIAIMYFIYVMVSSAVRWTTFIKTEY